MTHDLELAAAYVAGELTGNPHAEFESHLLTCEDCWTEVERGRQGRQLTTLAHEPVPDELRARIVAALATPPPPRRSPRPFPGRAFLGRALSRPAFPRRPFSRRAMALAAAGLAVVAAVVVGAVALRPGPPEPIDVAVAQFRANRLPGEQIPATQAPDLTRVGLNQTAAASGNLGGIPVTAYAYQDSTGRRLLIYVGRRSFATPANAENYEGGGAWISRRDGVSVLCSRDPHVTLVVGRDQQQVEDAAELLDLA